MSHDLVELLVVAVNAVLVGADTFAEIEWWVQEKRPGSGSGLLWAQGLSRYYCRLALFDGVRLAMSGPATADYTISLTAIFAAQVIGDVQASREAYDEALRRARERAAERGARQAAARAAVAARLEAIRAAAETLQRRIARLAALEGKDVATPVAPTDSDARAWSAWLLKLEGISNTLEAQVAAHAGSAVREALATLEREAASNPDSLESILALYLARRRAHFEAEGKAHNDAQCRETVERILARLDLAQGEPVPERLEALARAVILAETPERAELLGNELRLQVRQYQQDERARRTDMDDATRWLEVFAAANLPAPLLGRLEAVSAGLARLEAAERVELEAREAAFAAEQEALQARAAALVLEASLEDLGYQVDSIDETLFSAGGLVHFQRPGWDGHYVRLRANAKNKTFNFNVVRAENKAATSATQARDDLAAEERWCAEFPRLMATLAARGLELNVTRRLEAGEVPVQVVAPERLPDFSTPQARVRKKPAARRFDTP
ncbi:hypothetical protein FACS1894154_10250 [Betaproteobacteria bacterium]|nr:hypothetical protein FACS1894154_10250 [Betaproteobacteria bacterium]GHU30364.1 hypothetical protein FACS189497_10020 [Betaproteobacteria bacterium]